MHKHTLPLPIVTRKSKIPQRPMAPSSCSTTFQLPQPRPTSYIIRDFARFCTSSDPARFRTSSATLPDSSHPPTLARFRTSSATLTDSAPPPTSARFCTSYDSCPIPPPSWPLVGIDTHTNKDLQDEPPATFEKCNSMPNLFCHLATEKLPPMGGTFPDASESILGTLHQYRTHSCCHICT